MLLGLFPAPVSLLVFLFIRSIFFLSCDQEHDAAYECNSTKNRRQRKCFGRQCHHFQWTDIDDIFSGCVRDLLTP